MARRLPFASLAARTRGLWSARNRREQLLLMVLGALALVAVLLKLVIAPLQAARTTALADIRTAETLSARLRAVGPALGPGPAVTPRSGDPASIIASSAAEFGLPVQQQPAANGSIRITLTDASFDAVIRWLAELERSSRLRLSEIRLDRRPASGIVAGEVVLTI